MKGSKIALIIWLWSLLTPLAVTAYIETDQLYTRRFAFLVGANNGGKDRVTLRYAVDDAKAIENVLEEMGGVLPGDSRFLADPSKENFFKEIRELSQDVEQARKNFRRVEVIVYYSGHSDEGSLFLGDDRVSYYEFRDLITSMNADVRIAILDSCASGAFTLTKGVIKKSPFLLDTAYDMKGYAFMTSSSASEAAQESSRLKRSYFTHNLISGMRGGADMNQDGRITLNEAYQFAFDGTLTQTEKTMAGPQHPNYHIQMSGTGDVVITEIQKSTTVLVITKDVAGKIYIHNQDNVLVVELQKPSGREISIGLNAGTYRIINIDGASIQESKISLEFGKNQEVTQAQFRQTDKIPTRLRGDLGQILPSSYQKRVMGRWRVEMFGGFASMNPADLNLRAQFDDLTDTFYGYDYFQYLQDQGEITSFGKTNEGGKAKLIEYSTPFGIRMRYDLFNWLGVSLGFAGFSSTSESSFKNTYGIVETDGLTSTYSDEYKNYILAAKGYIPSLGIHLGKGITSSFRAEAFLTGGPLFAECRYSILYNSQWLAPGLGSDLEIPEDGLLEEKGTGVGLALQAGVKLDYYVFKHVGFFMEGGYAYQAVSRVSGPGIRSLTSHRDSWEGEWGIKQDIRQLPWGTARFLWPSNGWTIFSGTWWKTREFELDLSGFQLKLGMIYRF